MAFVYVDGVIESFAEFQDVLDHDQRLFDSNEGLSDTVVYPHLVRATERILTKIQSSQWFKDNTTDSIDSAQILTRHNDFTDLCVYTALSQYILPVIADFGTPDNAEIEKMKYYSQRMDSLLSELIADGDWYDWDNDGSITSNEHKPGRILPRRVR